jgi:drug/metabolite transporter (DMT)-like permease
MFFSLIGSFIGNLILKRLIKKYNRPSLIIWVIFGILSLACLVLPAQTIYNAVTKTGAFTFGALC